MTTQKLFIHVLIAAALSGAAASAAEPFVRAGASYTYGKFDPLTRQDSWEAGPLVAAGIALGSAREHELSIETGWTKWNGTSAVGGSQFETTQIPVLLNYRYTYSFSDGWGLFAGPTAGFIHQKYQKTNTAFQSLIGGTDNSWLPAYGGTVGVTAKIGKGWDAQVAYQLLRVNSDDIRTGTAGSLTQNPDYTRSSFQLSLSYSF